MDHREPTPSDAPQDGADAESQASVDGDGDAINDSGESDSSREASRVMRGTRRAVSAGQFVLRGLAISLPPILTLVILIWVTRGIYNYIIAPASATVRYAIGSVIDESELSIALATVPGDSPQLNSHRSWVLDEKFLSSPDGELYVRLGERAVPVEDYAAMARVARPGARPSSSTEFYMTQAERQYFGSFLTLNTLVLAFIVVLLYFLGRFVTARIGTWMVHRIETQFLARLPVVRNVYGSVKQVTDFLFSESEVEYRRVVAIEYPRRGIWSLGLVTGESMLEIATNAGEPCVSILIPSSPMPFTGYTINVPRSNLVDLDLTVDQAFQFCISCGVLVPPQQKFTAQQFQDGLARRLTAQLEAASARPQHPNHVAPIVQVPEPSSDSPSSHPPSSESQGAGDPE